MGGDTKPQQAQKTQDAQKQAGEKEQGDGLNQGAGKRKPQDKDYKEKNKRRRADKPAAVKGIHFRLLCYEGQAGAVIGKGGETVRNIRKTSNAEVSVLPPIQGHRLRVIAIDSPPGNRAAMSYPAKEALLTCSTLTVEGDQPLTAPDPSKMVEVRLLVQSDLATGLLGLKHSLGSLTAGDISARCGANVIMPPDSDRPKLAESGEEYLLLRGPWPAVYAALGMVADEVRRQFFELREPLAEPPLGPPPAAFGFPGGPPMGPPLGPFDPLEAMQLGIGLGMEMAVAAGVAGPPLAGPVHGNAPLPGGGSGSGLSVPHGGDLSISGLIPEFRSSAEASTPVTVTFKLVVPENKAGRFIGKGGENLRDIRLALGLSTLKVHPAVKETAVRVLEVTSTEPAGSKRCAAVEALLYYVDRLGMSAPQNANANNRGRFTVKMLLQQQQCGPVVGPRAAVIRQVSALTNASCVVHKKGDMPPYGAPDEQELEAEGDPPNVMEAIRMVAAIIRGCELRRQGISVRETMGTPEFDLVRGSCGGGGGPHGPFAPMGPMMPVAPSDGVAMGHIGPAGASQPSMPPPSQQRQLQQIPQQQYPPQQQQRPQQQLHEERYIPTPTQPQGHVQASDPQPQLQQQQLPPHLQKPPLQKPPQLGAGTSAGQSTVGSQSGSVIAGLPPLGPNDVRLTIFVAAALVNAPEGINGTNVQQVQAVTNTVVTLRQPVVSGDYELDITGTIAQVMQAHTLLSNIMTIGAILQQKPQLAPQQAPTSAVGAVGGGAGGSGQPSAVTATAPVTTASGAQHQVVVQPNQGVVIATQPPPQQQQPAAIQSPVHPQQGAPQPTQQQQQSQQPVPQPAAQAQAAPTSAQAVPSQPPAAFSGAGQQIPQQQQQQQQRQQVPLQQQQAQVQQQVQQQRPLQQPSQGVPQQQQQGQQQRPQQYPYNSELAVTAQQEAPVQRQAQTQQQPYPAQPPAQSQPPAQQQQPAPQPAAVTSAPYQQQAQTQQQPSVSQASTYPQNAATPAATLQPQQYAPAPQSQAQQSVYSQQYGQPYTQEAQTQQHAYYGQQTSQAQQTLAQGANPFPTYGSAGYSSTNGIAQAPAAAPVQPGSQGAATTYDGQYAHAAATVQTQTPPTGAPAAGPAPGATSTTSPFGPQSQQQPYPGYGAAGYHTTPTASHAYYQQSSQAPPQQQPQQPGAPSAHDQYYMHMQQQYAAYQAAAVAAATASTPYPPAVYGYSYGTSSAPGPQ
ncbi:hypothetical protein VaNZ11_008142 [Volvox africanus]|uniref:K Homology domain-containing protein n=1 Tax=Volvox africanus TaxID=51714 RepID=A0ABQ5S4N0_9CHLO|nr:hypothetical protein VaNZ11_008142 [Volvox africanus]